MRGVDSTFQFIHYKVDVVEFHIKPDLNVVQYFPTPQDQISYTINLRVPMYFVQQNQYLSGVEIQFKLFHKEEKPENELCNGRFGIMGVFAITGEPPEQDFLDKMVKTHFPSLLIPYLRAFITSTLAHAGFGSVVMPLINMYSVSDEALKNMPIQRIE